MDRDKIIKALRCCAERFWMCDECPYEEEEGCEAEMLSDASDLIRELTEENELLKAGISTEFTCIFGAPHKVRDCPIDEEVAKARADIVQEMQTRLAMHFGTYTEDDAVTVREVLWIVAKIAEEMLEGE